MSVTYYDFTFSESFGDNKEVFKYIKHSVSASLSLSVLSQKFLSGITLDVRDTSGLINDDYYLFRVPAKKVIRNLFFKMRFNTIFHLQTADLVARTVFGSVNNDVVIPYINIGNVDMPDCMYDVQSATGISFLDTIVINPRVSIINGCFVFPKVSIQPFFNAFLTQKFIGLFKPSTLATADSQTFNIVEVATPDVIIYSDMVFSLVAEY